MHVEELLIDPREKCGNGEYQTKQVRERMEQEGRVGRLPGRESSYEKGGALFVAQLSVSRAYPWKRLFFKELPLLGALCRGKKSCPSSLSPTIATNATLIQRILKTIAAALATTRSIAEVAVITRTIIRTTTKRETTLGIHI
jgi:hypothetical protein